MRTRAILSHTAQAVAEGALIALLVVGLAAGTTFAAKGGGGSSGGGGGGGGHHGGGGTTGGGGTIALAMVVDLNGNGSPNYGDTITFVVSTTATTQPWVNVVCSQNGTVVASGWVALFDGALSGPNLGLYSPAWTGGAADCVAYLTTPDWTRLASMTFHVDA